MQAQRNLYNEIDLLEIVKQLRISKFMSTFILNNNQRELVKFMKQYTLLTRLPRGRTRTLTTTNLNAIEDNSEGEFTEIRKASPYEDLLEYNPKVNKIDKLLHEGILD